MLKRFARTLLCFLALAQLPMPAQGIANRYITAKIWPKNANQYSIFVVSPIQECIFRKKGNITEIQFRRVGESEYIGFDISKLDRIDYELSAEPVANILPVPANAPAKPVSSTAEFKGRWTGTYRNSLGDSGSTTLVFVSTAAGIGGTLDGEAFANAVWDGTTLRWSYTSPANKVTYHCEFRFTGPSTGKLTYTASGARSYSGTVDNYVRQ